MHALEESDHPAVIAELGKSGTGLKEAKRGALLTFQGVLASEASHTPDGTASIEARCANHDDLAIVSAFKLKNLPSSLSGAALGEIVWTLGLPLHRLLEGVPGGPTIPASQSTAVGALLSIVQKAVDKVSAASAVGTREKGLRLPANVPHSRRQPLDSREVVACPDCKCLSGMPVASNANLEAHNAKARSNYEDKVQAWTDAGQNGRKPGRIGPNKEFTMAFACQCANNQCAGNTDGSGCYACAAQNGGMMQVDPLNPRGGKICACPMCQCNCARTWHAGDEQEIAILKALADKNGASANSNDGTAVWGEVMAGALRAGMTAIGSTSSSSSSSTRSSPLDQGMEAASLHLLQSGALPVAAMVAGRQMVPALSKRGGHQRGTFFHGASRNNNSRCYTNRLDAGGGAGGGGGGGGGSSSSSCGRCADTCWCRGRSS